MCVATDNHIKWFSDAPIIIRKFAKAIWKAIDGSEEVKIQNEKPGDA